MTLDDETQHEIKGLFRRFALFGISTRPQHFDLQVSRIEEICDVDGKVVLLELAPNYAELVDQGILRPNMYVSIAEHWKGRYSKLIAGDQELTIPENPDWILGLAMGESYYYPKWNREKIMRENIVKEKPDIVIVGNGNSDMIKNHFPHAYYTVFEIDGGYSASSTGHDRGIHEWNNPGKVIKLPSEY
ncbi:MAG: hypothetical protein KJ597_06920 [Nanoarchaeota archaeon]|nr:hypothetical protein [Nanoarchaeota archaeon]MBU1623280.1 hypothetical protein [Nanoarchaeota archaeon]